MRRGILILLVLLVWSGPLFAQFKPGETVAQHRAARDAFLRGDLSPLALVHRTVWGNRKSLRIGGPSADLQLPTKFPVKPYAVRLTEEGGSFFIAGIGGYTVATVAGRTERKFPTSSGPFRFESYILNFRPTGLPQGPVLDIYDSKSPAQQPFHGVDAFPETATYRVQAQLTPLGEPQKIILVDSHGFNRPYWIYGHLTFRLESAEVRMEVYTTTLDAKEIARDGFMLIFADASSGKETYKSGRYLYIAGEHSGTVEVDFNKAYNPPCSFSPVFTCPFPRKENRLPVAIRAGEKTYTGPAAKPLP